VPASKVESAIAFGLPQGEAIGVAVAVGEGVIVGVGVGEGHSLLKKVTVSIRQPSEAPLLSETRRKRNFAGEGGKAAFPRKTWVRT
jgi:hypothetical protein